MSLCVRKQTIWVPTRSDTNQAVQSQKMVRGLKFWIQKVEKLYYPCSENKGVDQLRSYCEADLRLCFRLCRLLVFPCGGSYENVHRVQTSQNIKQLEPQQKYRLGTIRIIILLGD